jgi:hypothetical protein
MAKIPAVVVEANRERGCQRVQVLFGTNCFLEITDNAGPFRTHGKEYLR